MAALSPCWICSLLSLSFTLASPRQQQGLVSHRFLKLGWATHKVGSCVYGCLSPRPSGLICKVTHWCGLTKPLSQREEKADRLKAEWTEPVSLGHQAFSLRTLEFCHTSYTSCLPTYMCFSEYMTLSTQEAKTQDQDQPIYMTSSHSKFKRKRMGDG